MMIMIILFYMKMWWLMVKRVNIGRPEKICIRISDFTIAYDR